MINTTTRLLVAVAIVLAVISGCKDSGTQTGAGQISMTSKYSAVSPVSLPKAGTSGQVAAVDSIVITRARFVLSRVKFEGNNDSAEFKSAPFVFEPSLSGSVQNVAVAGVPYGSYHEVKFKLHHIDSSDVRGLSTAELVPFADFLAGERYSIIVDGFVYAPGAGAQAFTFKSKIDVEQEYHLSIPIVVDGSHPSVNVTMLVNSAGWFVDIGGTLLDPTLSGSQSKIDNSIKASMKIFKDDDEDGSEDDH